MAIAHWTEMISSPAPMRGTVNDLINLTLIKLHLNAAHLYLFDMVRFVLFLMALAWRLDNLIYIKVLDISWKTLLKPPTDINCQLLEWIQRSRLMI